MLTRENLIEALQNFVSTYDTAGEAAEAIGISPSRLSLTLSGRAAINGRLQEFFAVERFDAYRIKGLNSRHSRMIMGRYGKASEAYDDAVGSFERDRREAAELRGDGGAGAGEGDQLADGQPEHDWRPATATLVPPRTRLRKGRVLPPRRTRTENPGSNIQRLVRLSYRLSDVQKLKDYSPEEFKAAMACLRQVLHPNSRSTLESREIAAAEWKRFTGREYRPPRQGCLTTRPGPMLPQVRAGLVAKQRAWIDKHLSAGSLVVVTADQDLRMQAADELVKKGSAVVIYDRVEPVHSGPLPKGKTERRERRILKIAAGEQRI